MIPVQNYKLNRPQEIKNADWNIPKLPENTLKIGFINILSTYGWHTRGEEYQKKVPYFDWARRAPAALQLIAEERPALLGLCELDFRHIKVIQAAIEEGGLLQGYILHGFSAQIHETIETAQSNNYADNDWAIYGSFVALLVDLNRISLGDRAITFKCHPLPAHPTGQKWKQILIEAHVVEKATSRAFACLVSHFNYKNPKFRYESCKKELEIIRRLEEQKIPWVSIGDRNWGGIMREKKLSWDPEIAEKEANSYVDAGSPFVIDTRDENLLGCFGLLGTFLRKLHKQQISQVDNLDTAFRSRNSTEGIVHYTRTGKYSTQTQQLLPDHANLPPEAGYISDHLMVIIGIRFKNQ